MRPGFAVSSGAAAACGCIGGRTGGPVWLCFANLFFHAGAHESNDTVVPGMCRHYGSLRDNPGSIQISRARPVSVRRLCSYKTVESASPATIRPRDAELEGNSGI